MRILFTTFAFGIAALAVAACGGGTSGTGASSTGGSTSGSTSGSTTATGGSTSGSTSSTASGPSAAQACADQAHASCTERDTCAPGFNNAHVYGSEAICEMRAALTCVTSLQAKGQANTPSHIESCVGAYPGYECVDYFDGNPPAACIPPSGSQANGMPCGASGQCQSTFCDVTQFENCGICAAVPTPGTLCQVQADCGRNLACAISTGATSGTCASYVAANGACLTGKNPCQAGLSCMGDNEAGGTMGTCQTAGATVGAACDGSRKTMASCYSELGLVCIPTAKGSAVGTCQKITLVAAGAACGDIGAAPITGFADCEAGGACIKGADGGTMGTCVAPAADGAACDSDNTKGPPCLSPAKCVPTADGGTAGTCTVPDATKCM